jgi:hypothetical protein
MGKPLDFYCCGHYKVFHNFHIIAPYRKKGNARANTYTHIHK